MHECMCEDEYLWGDHVKVESLHFHKVGVSPQLHNLAFIHAHDAVGILNGRQSARGNGNKRTASFRIRAPE